MRGASGVRARPKCAAQRFRQGSVNPITEEKETQMSTNDTYLAVFLGSRNGSRMKAWMEMSESERKAKEQEGMAAWGGWMQKHQASIVSMGGPLGKTNKVTAKGVEDVSNDLGGYVVVRANSHEAA